MKVFRLLLLSIFSGPFLLHSQTLFFNGNLGLDSHLANVDKNERKLNNPVPSIGVFFSDGFSVGGEIQFAFTDIRKEKASWMWSLLYEHATHASSEEKPNILGDELIVNNLGLMGGFWFQITPFVFLRAEAGFIERFIVGRGSIDESKSFEVLYSESSALRFLTGFTFVGVSPNSVSFGLTLGYNLASVKRGDIKFSSSGKYFGKLKPAGDISLPDDYVSLKVELSYPLYYGSK
ncbi:MAG: hypothetical protein HYV28_19560 [Ignavibacteriales bacterium]|nr:hypothetical protein [Ignavibacteriales bacterium]